MSKDVKCPFLHRVAELYQPGLTTRVVDEQNDLWTPKFDVLRLEPKQVLPNGVVYKALGDISPVLRRAKKVDEEEQACEDTDGCGSVRAVDEEHCDS